jgi:hypothetical protein
MSSASKKIRAFLLKGRGDQSKDAKDENAGKTKLQLKPILVMDITFSCKRFH